MFGTVGENKELVVCMERDQILDSASFAYGILPLLKDKDPLDKVFPEAGSVSLPRPPREGEESVP